jgi:hypothetical protein
MLQVNVVGTNPQGGTALPEVIDRGRHGGGGAESEESGQGKYDSLQIITSLYWDNPVLCILLPRLI